MTRDKAIFETRSADETLEIGRQIGQAVVPDTLVVLDGHLGTGKTVLAHGIAVGLDIDTWRGSPTFDLVHEYRGRLPFYHIDAYRLTADELLDLDLRWMDAAQGVVAVEWGGAFLEHLRSVFKRHLWQIRLSDQGEDHRRVEVRP